MKLSQVKFSGPAFFGLLLAVMVLSAGGTVVVGDEETMFRLTQNLLTGHGLAVSQEEIHIPAQNHPGFLPIRVEILLTTSAIPGRDGQTYSKYGLGSSLAAIPLYLLGWALDLRRGLAFPAENARLAVSMLNSLAWAACGWVMVIFSKELGYRTSTSRLLALAALFSTFAWPYVKTFYPQPSVAFFLLLAVYCAFRWRRDGLKRHLWLVGVCCAGVILFRISEVIILPALFAYLIFSVPPERRWQWIVPVGAGIAFSLGVTAWYNWLRFGSLFTTGYDEIAWNTPFWFGLYGLLLSPGKSLLFYAPVLVLSLGAWRLFSRQHRSESWLIAGLWLSFLVFYAPYKYWTGGWNWGPRFLLPVVPLVALPLGAFLEASRDSLLADSSLPGAGFRSQGYSEKRALLTWLFFAIFTSAGFFLQLPAILVDHSRYLYQQVYETADSGAYTRTIVNPEYSPIFRQWPVAFEMIAAYRKPETWQAAQVSLVNMTRWVNDEVQNALPLLEAEFYRRNTFGFWWLHNRYMDTQFPVSRLVLPWLALAFFSAGVLRWCDLSSVR